MNKDWIMELCPEIAEWQAEIIAEQVRIRVKSEREACARLCDGWTHADGDACAEAIRARGGNWLNS